MSGVDKTPHLSSTHFAGDPDPYYPPSYPPMPQSMHAEPQSIDSTISDSHSRDRHAQYANLMLPVPHGQSTPPLPSAIFPSSIGSFPPTATTAEFLPSTSGLGIPPYYYEPSVKPDTELSLVNALKSELQPEAYTVLSSQQSSRIESTILSSHMRAHASLDSQLGSAQVARPHSGGEVEHRIRRQQLPSLRSPRSPVYEELDARSSSVSPVRMQTSHLFNTIDPFHDLADNEVAPMDHQKESESSGERHLSLLPPTTELPDGTSPFRHSFQTHATVGSTAYGHDGPSLPLTPTSMSFPDQERWSVVIQSIKTAENNVQANLNVDRASVEALSSAKGHLSSNASQLNFSISQRWTNSSQLPPPFQGSSSDGVFPSASITSGTDSFSAFDLMSFPNPPTAGPGQQGSPTPGTRSPWVKGLTLPMPTNMVISRRSFKEPGTPTSLPHSFASVPLLPLEPSSTPSTPLSIPNSNPTFRVVKTPSRVVVTTHYTPVPIIAIPEGRESWWLDSRSPSPPSRATSPPLQGINYLRTGSVSSSVEGNTAAKSKCYLLGQI